MVDNYFKKIVNMIFTTNVLRLVLVFVVLLCLLLVGCSGAELNKRDSGTTKSIEPQKSVEVKKSIPAVAEQKGEQKIGQKTEQNVEPHDAKTNGSTSLYTQKEYATNNYSKSNNAKDEYKQSDYKQSPIFTKLKGCEEKKDVVFTSLPIAAEKITVIEPQGELTGYVSGHITPGDHVGFQYDANAGAIPVYALADGYLVRVERNPGYFGIGVKNYHFYFEYSCTLFGSYVHITEVAPELLAADASFAKLDGFSEEKLPLGQNFIYPRIPVKAGQMIGKVEKWGLLGMLTVDSTVSHSGFISSKIYDGEPWKMHAVPVFGYFSPALQSQIDLKNPRTVEPRGGKIDFDVPGKLVGNWFVEGTDYASSKKIEQYCGDYLCPYWANHLSFVYDSVEPSQVRVSIGSDMGLGGDSGPYGVLGNSPDPKTISVASGIVKYELVKLKDVTAARGFKSQGKALITENTNEVLGTLLVSMSDENHLKMEVFAKKKANEVAGFSGKEKMYYR